MKLVVLSFVAIELFVVLYCADYREFNTTFSTINFTNFNGKIIKIRLVKPSMSFADFRFEAERHPQRNTSHHVQKLHHRHTLDLLVQLDVKLDGNSAIKLNN